MNIKFLWKYQSKGYRLVEQQREEGCATCPYCARLTVQRLLLEPSGIGALAAFFLNS